VPLPSDHPAVAATKIGVLLVNLGTPDAPTTAAVRRYLGEFLSDKRVIEIPQIVWQPILRGIILNTRPKKSAHAYSQVWTPQGSPLAAITAAQATALKDVLGANVIVDWAMRYGNPSVASKLTAMKAMGCERILIAPLYPQYCAATTASVMDAVSAAVGKMRWQPALRTLPPYFDNAHYIGALKASVDAQLATLDFLPDLVLASFHGMPAATLTKGDPYHCQCQKTARLLREALGLPLRITFQSRFGAAKWLEPATDSVLKALPAEGYKKIAVVTPGFAADCLETLEEIAIRGREEFIGAGGTHFATLACLNDSVIGIEMMRKLLQTELAGWVMGS